ncbi:extensin family protein [Pseudohoeflea suaedae]|uniref:extensin-like domain-containing protein n=1 Tax=Pseudohoeflea suaedae TaxID=877384 RepID=UPI001304EA74|nr:extensin family protein [Pseudohoeflea suaedae]
MDEGGEEEEPGPADADAPAGAQEDGGSPGAERDTSGNASGSGKPEAGSSDRQAQTQPPEPVDPVCVARLAELGAIFEAVEPIEGEGGCGIAHPFEISGFSGGISLQPAAKLDCPTAVALAEWVEDELKPAADTAIRTLTDEEKPEGKALKTIRQASSYICRTRNSQKDAKLSEHGKGRAIDIAGFTLADGTDVTVTPREKDHTIAAALQAAVRKGACLHFTTVLGPGADSFHSDHIHIDLAERRGGYRICQ